MDFAQPFLENITFLASDAFVFVVVHFVLLFLVLYAATLGRAHAHRAGKRRRISSLVLAYSVLSASIVQAVSATDLVSGFKMLITITDLAAAFYLCFMNPWFRSIIFGLVRQGQKVQAN